MSAVFAAPLYDLVGRKIAVVGVSAALAGVEVNLRASQLDSALHARQGS